MFGRGKTHLVVTYFGINLTTHYLSHVFLKLAKAIASLWTSELT